MRWLGIAVLAVVAVVACKARPLDNPLSDGVSIHAAGILDPTSADFHGALVAAAGWRFTTCESCHGADLRGGAAKVDCEACHAGGPKTCTTCHGQPPMTGSHVEHLTTAGVACEQCHVVPATYDAPGHPGQGVVFGARAGSTARFEPATATCSGVYCHGGVFVDTAAQLTAPTWGGGGGQAACGTCHGLPPSPHQSPEPCVACHYRTVDSDMAIVNRALHGNGVFDVGDGSGGCTSCHGNATKPLSGAHQAHLTAGHLRGPLACSDCHVTPVGITSAGHIDTGPPAEVTFGALARAGGATPMFNGGSCAGTACHGGATTTWNGTRDQALCGSCHGVPPATHDANLALTDCASCHPSTVDRFGNILITGEGASTHINGQVDVQ